MRIIYIPVKDERVLNLSVLSDLSSKKVAVTSTIQFKHRIPEVMSHLPDSIECPTLLGCRASIPEKADVVLVIATGVFHALNAAVTSGKPVYLLSPEGFSELDSKLVSDFQKKQAIRVSKVLEAETIGVLVSTKSGQAHEELGREIVEQLRTRGKQAYLFIANELSPLQLNDFPIDAWVNTACPRIVEDEFDKPIINWIELREHI